MDQVINPNDFIISRKRKLYKFALFKTLSNCYDTATWLDARSTIMANQYCITLEVGAGSGLFLTELARRHPDQLFVALDRKSDRLISGAKQALADGLKNIYFIWSEVQHLTDLVAPSSINTLWITFPDPWPQESNIKHRLTNQNYLKDYRIILADNGVVQFKTDNVPLFKWSQEQFNKQFTVEYVTSDLHHDQAITGDDDALVMTSYEARYHESGKPINYLRATV